MSDRIVQFDGLRALAFLGVFAHHAVHLPLTWMGVDMFFVLSGFLITRILLRSRAEETTGSSLATFYFRRLLRIVPPYYLTLVAMLVAYPVAASDAAWYFGFASNIRDSLQGPSLGPYNSMWSIAVEEQFYLLWPLGVLFLPRRALVITLVTVLFAATAFRLLFADLSFAAVYRLMPCRMDLLAAGALLAVVDLEHPTALATHRSKFLALAGGALALFAAFSITVPTFRTSVNSPVFNVMGFGLSVGFFSSVLAYVRTDAGPVSRILCTPVLQYIGKISYACYLLHLLVLELLKSANLGRIASAVLGLAITLALASISWHFIERPICRLRGLVPSQPRGASAA